MSERSTAELVNFLPYKMKISNTCVDETLTNWYQVLMAQNAVILDPFKALTYM